MKTKTLVILLIIMGLLAGAGALMIRQKAPEGPKKGMGAYLLEQLPVNRIISITIKGAVDTVSLVKKEDRWVVKNRFNYPADFSKITDFVRKLKDVKIGREFGSSEETLKRLSLKDPDDPEAPEGEKGMRVHLKGEEETPLADILLGKTRQTGTERSFPNGQYLLLGREPKIYLIDKHFSSLEKTPSAWLDKSLARVEAKDIKKIAFLSQDSKKTRFAFERPEKDKDFQPLNLPVDSKVEKSALNQLAGALSSLQMEDVVDPSIRLESIGMEISTLFEYHLFNGVIYRVWPGKTCSEDDPCYLKLEVAYQKPSGESDETVKGDGFEVGPEDVSEENSKEVSKKEEAVSKKTPEEEAFEAKQLNDRLSPWVYTIPKWKHDDFVTDLNQLLEKSDKN